MMDDTEADNFRRIQLKSEVERAVGLIAQHRESIEFYRERLDEYHNWLGHIEERLGEPEKGDMVTIEEMDAHIAYMDAHNKRLYEEIVAQYTERIAIAKYPETREYYQQRLERVHAIRNGKG